MGLAGRIISVTIIFYLLSSAGWEKSQCPPSRQSLSAKYSIKLEEINKSIFLPRFPHKHFLAPQPASRLTSGCPKWETLVNSNGTSHSYSREWHSLDHHITAYESSTENSEIKDLCFIQSQTPLIPNFASITSLISYRHLQHAVCLCLSALWSSQRHKCYFLLCFVFFFLIHHSSPCLCHLYRAGLN